MTLGAIPQVVGGWRTFGVDRLRRLELCAFRDRPTDWLEGWRMRWDASVFHQLVWDKVLMCDRSSLAWWINRTLNNKLFQAKYDGGTSCQALRLRLWLHVNTTQQPLKLITPQWAELYFPKNVKTPLFSEVFLFFLAHSLFCSFLWNLGFWVCYVTLNHLINSLGIHMERMVMYFSVKKKKFCLFKNSSFFIQFIISRESPGADWHVWQRRYAPTLMNPSVYTPIRSVLCRCWFSVQISLCHTSISNHKTST